MSRSLALLPLLLVTILGAGCASYVTPGGSVHLADIDRADIASLAARRPSPNFPASIAVVRVQAPEYRSFSAEGYGEGRFSVLTVQELLTETQQAEIAKWPSVAGLSTVNRLLLPARLDSLDDLRLAAAKLQADVLLIYTIDTTFNVQGRPYGPLTALSLGLAPDRDANVTSTASAIFMDVRTGFTYGTAESTAKASGLTNAWSSRETVDQKRLEAEHRAFDGLVTASGTTWSGIVDRYR